MEMTVQIRAEQPQDIPSVDALTALAFEGQEFSDGSEVPILRLLRADGDLTLSLIADVAGQIVGHVAFSPVKIGQMSGAWFGLGPISVHPDRQRQGIGRALVAEGVSRMRARGADGIVLIGDPQVYHPMGFQSEGRVTYQGIDRQYVHWMALGPVTPEGEITYAPAFTDWDT